ncbi:MAG: hypothetical protein A3C93_05860 [Candidatus Lloydbacteria bacterium RIFCSPHIGHO2_02_FULL_54_17]|uniref:Carbonic anhydrase n=1 Tax=Candidatus Lloydbacteria bacterium RIFCSPHIGHO2_02_FULL_54_17 TaxID=1798664 RepID=A0A1G2DE66_9BACT|nr:MAG: hypothetical protein A2762_02340 [Candidatus Lloydbacteria bacterium RIFCSPHIGHO2_01_FULL_54_11]OGZ11937.1 MAG: hypothetical protein A3C93_05860 [Candidatus Lloydbacteria bacterium RIFCSPHIGHO2_02_FULL_54_17]OGZ14191.1 MAG: hypothetical protein A2948_02550 [Candidatus Lloydbacteria bacterium RIFCSPLOWO2_01_FULL_54_18]OGZ15081.1 MAG: hypothetical protein A3H76_06680 [Candidatus Lloydbacteria bacterium RIFCSPLOWO2_02_FULL_54_12]
MKQRSAFKHRENIMSLVLSEEDRRTIRMFSEKKVRVLRKVRPQLVDETNGAILVTCADGDQMENVFLYHRKICLHHREEHRPHLLSLNGGAKLIASDSPLRHGDEDTVLLGHLKDARRMKGIETIVLYAHAPCGAAYAHKLSFYRVLELLFAGRERVEREMPGVKVTCFCHVDYGNGKKHTYFASRTSWLLWRAAPTKPVRRAGIDYSPTR